MRYIKYIGNLEQQNFTIASLATDLKQHGPGIFIVAGGAMVGKDTTVKKGLAAAGLATEGSDRPLLTDEMEL